MIFVESGRLSDWRGGPLEATNQNIPPLRSDPRWQMLGGDRFYALARWLVLILLFAIAGLLTKEPIWPPTIARNPIHIIIWCYTVFNILATLALLIPSLRVVRAYAFIADIAVIT